MPSIVIDPNLLGQKVCWNDYSENVNEYLKSRCDTFNKTLKNTGIIRGIFLDVNNNPQLIIQHEKTLIRKYLPDVYLVE